MQRKVGSGFPGVERLPASVNGFPLNVTAPERPMAKTFP